MDLRLADILPTRHGCSGDLCLAVNLSPPPSDADEQKPPVLEKFRRLAFERMADELKNPSQDK